MAHLYLNGRIVPEEDALIPVTDRAILFGDGAYETMRSYSGQFFRFPEHLARLRQTLTGLSLQLPASDAEITRGAMELIKANQLPDARVRLTVTGGQHDGQIRLARSHSPTLFMTAGPLTPPPTQAVRDGVTVTVSPWKVHSDSPLPRLKTINRLMHLMAKEDAFQKGAWDSLFCDEADGVLEGTMTNVFFVVDGTLRTAALDAPILPGVTRQVVLEEARKEGVPVIEGPISLADALNAEEGFLTSTTIEVLPIRSIDGTVLGNGKPGPVSQRLKDRYTTVVQQELG